MMRPPAPDVTRLLHAWGGTEESGLAKLMPLVYDELSQAARRYMVRQRPDHTLQATALANEAYLWLANIRQSGWQDRAHFFAICARLMPWWTLPAPGSTRNAEGERTAFRWRKPWRHHGTRRKTCWPWIRPLTALAAVDARKSQVVGLLFFGRLSVKETGEMLQVSEETVQPDWKLAKLWMLRELRGEKTDGS
jgi:hypothetical protein